MEEEKINPGHRGMRDALRVIGPIIAAVGLILAIVGVVSLVRTGSLNYGFFVMGGMPLLFVVLVLSSMGYMGKIARYQAWEIAPVGKDTFNYMADGTKDGVKTLATAIGSGLGAGIGAGAAAAGGGQQTKIRCHKCNALLEEDSKFCNECGAPLSKSKPCPKCNELNDGDAKFCDNCGQNFG